MHTKITKSVAVIVAHPDDETLWAGGMVLSHPSWQWYIVCLCDGNETDRAAKFQKALKILKSDGIMGNLKDVPDLKPIDEEEVEHAIMELLPSKHFDLIITHNPTGEFLTDLRHEQVSKAVIKLWHGGKISAYELWTFAYENGEEGIYPKPVETAPVYRTLTNRIWLRKHSIITDTYGYIEDSFEAGTSPKAEAFWQFMDPDDAKKWIKKAGISV